MKTIETKKPTVLKLDGMTITIAPPIPPSPPPAFSNEANTTVEALRAECEATPERRVACIDFQIDEQRFVLRGHRGGRPQFDFRIECFPTERDDPLKAKHVVHSMELNGDDLRGIVDELLHQKPTAYGLARLAESFANSCEASRVLCWLDERKAARLSRSSEM